MQTLTPATTLLPDAFRELEPFVEWWAGATTDIRWDRRARSAMPDIERFYAAMQPRADEALRYLEQFPLGDMPEDATRLLRLVLALPHAAMAVEFHGQPRAVGSPFPHGMNIGRGPWPEG